MKFSDSDSDGNKSKRKRGAAGKLGGFVRGLNPGQIGAADMGGKPRHLMKWEDAGADDWCRKRLVTWSEDLNLLFLSGR